jgi:hypothetical protein
MIAKNCDAPPRVMTCSCNINMIAKICHGLREMTCSCHGLREMTQNLSWPEGDGDDMREMTCNCNNSYSMKEHRN